MNREAVGAVVLALVAVVSVALISATVTNTVQPAESGGEGGPVPESPPGTDAGGGGGETEPSRAETDGGEPSVTIETGGGPSRWCYSVFDHPPALAAALVGIVGLFLGVQRVYDRLAALGGTLIVTLLGVWVALVLRCPGTAEANKPYQGSSAAESGMMDQPAGPLQQITPDAPLWLFLIVAVLAVGVAVVAVSGRGRIADALVPTANDEDEAAESGHDVAAVGRVAGRAADRIETGVDVENEVFRAWRTMTDHLDVDRPHSSTPAEFADAAVEAGFDPEAVGELTALFEAVRYGGQAPTDERERRAVAALRRVERDAAETGSQRGDGS